MVVGTFSSIVRGALLALIATTLLLTFRSTIALAEATGDVAEEWRALSDALDRNDLSSAHTSVERLELLRRKLGLDSMSRYSEALLLRGKEESEEGDVDASAFLCRSALALSPRHPEVMLHAITLCHRSGVEKKLSQLLGVLFANHDNPLTILRVLRTTWYPLLHALTGGVLFVLVIYLIWHVQRSLSVLKQLMPWRSMVLATVIYIGAVLAPLLFGPLWCLLVWSCLVLLVAPWHRAGVVFAGLTLALWGVSIPLRENLERWLAHPGLAESVELAIGRLDLSHDPVALRRDLELLTKLRNSDSMPRFALARLLGLDGNYEAAELSLQNVAPIYEQQGWVASERATWAFLRRDLKSADVLYGEAERLGQRSAEFYYNISLVKAEMTDLPGARAYFAKALQIDEQRARELSAREVEVSEEQRRFAVPVPLSLSLIWDSVTVPVPGDTQVEEELSGMLMRGSNPFVMILFGGVLLIASLLRGEGKHLIAIKNSRAMYRPPTPIEWLIRIVPGGSWALKGSLVIAMIFCSAFVFLLLPSTSYFPEATYWLYTMAGIKKVYLSTVGVVSVFVVFLGFQIEID